MTLANIFRRRVEAASFSRDLFQAWVIDDLENEYEEYAISWRCNEQFDEAKCRYTFYVYLVAVVAVALTAAVEKRPEFVWVLSYLKGIASSKASTDWSIHEDTFDNDVVEAGNSLAKLLFRNPSENPALSLEWPAQWLGSFGVTEHNAVRLFQISHYWTTSFLYLCRLFDKIKVFEKK